MNLSIVRGRALWAALLGVYAFAVLVGISGWSNGSRLGFTGEFVAGDAIVTSVLPGGVAWEANVHPGDVLLSVNGSVPAGTEGESVSDHGSTLTARSASTGEIIEWSRQMDSLPSAGLTAALILVSFSFFVVSALVELRASRNVLIYRFSILSMVAARGCPA